MNFEHFFILFIFFLDIMFVKILEIEWKNIWRVKENRDVIQFLMKIYY